MVAGAVAGTGVGADGHDVSGAAGQGRDPRRRAVKRQRKAFNGKRGNGKTKWENGEMEK